MPLGSDDLLKDVPFIFRAGENGYAVYRTPAVVVSKEGTVLAFAEGRVNNPKDEGDIDVVLKRSIDGGKTWGELQVLEDDGPNPCKNACPVVLESGRILYVWLWNESIPSEDDRTTREVYVSYSDDDGLTWSESKNITSSVYRNDNYSLPTPIIRSKIFFTYHLFRQSGRDLGNWSNCITRKNIRINGC